MSETQKTVCEWADSTFGPCDVAAAYRRMIKEVDEMGLLDEQLNHAGGVTTDMILNELADIIITGYRFAEMTGFDLMACVDAKMKVNRERKWKVAGDGTGQHL